MVNGANKPATGLKAESKGPRFLPKRGLHFFIQPALHEKLADLYIVEVEIRKLVRVRLLAAAAPHLMIICRGGIPNRFRNYTGRH